ncbi:hypothetical protein ACEZCY_24235 [Streptacidiphilus sp. N1-12]|uniref:DMSO/TMAO reductase YedYZ, heme-binding membrane subunit n=2 Tax=Streptacidiphilus alkalitolerans TaxID=3342712 RepID=A0ABV6V805_9ACTN
MTARTRHIRRTTRTARPRSLSFPLFLIMVCAAVTIGTTAIRALGGGPDAPGMSGAVAGTAGRFMAFLDYFAGVFTLLSLTAAVVCGLAATDRLVLSARHRVAMQSVHRATSVAALGFLATHIAVKVAEQDATPLVALLPFGGGATFAVGLGTLAADLLVLTAATGAVRGRFAGSRRPWLWRVLHSGAYACWPIALAHGLTAGRAAAVWVLWSYGLCAAAVGLALLVRLLGAAGRGSARRRTVRTLRAYRPRTPKGAAEEPLSLATHGQHSVYAEPAEPVQVQAPAPAPVPDYGPVPDYVPDYAQHAAYPYQPQYAEAAYGSYGYPAPSPWAGDGQARPHPTLTETPPHGFSVPGNLFGTPYAPAPAPAYAPDWLEDSGSWTAWSALTWDTPPQGVPVFPEGGPIGSVYVNPGVQYQGSAHEHGGGW